VELARRVMAETLPKLRSVSPPRAVRARYRQLYGLLKQFAKGTGRLTLAMGRSGFIRVEQGWGLHHCTFSARAGERGRAKVQESRLRAALSVVSPRQADAFPSSNGWRGFREAQDLFAMTPPLFRSKRRAYRESSGRGRSHHVLWD
jgi:hypothetical protein